MSATTKQLREQNEKQRQILEFIEYLLTAPEVDTLEKLRIGVGTILNALKPLTDEEIAQGQRIWKEYCECEHRPGCGHDISTRGRQAQW